MGLPTLLFFLFFCDKADDGWVVSSRVRLGLVERAMQLQESGSTLCETGEALCETLLDERWLRRLENLRRAPCARCGATCNGRDPAEAVGGTPSL